MIITIVKVQNHFTRAHTWREYPLVYNILARCDTLQKCESPKYEVYSILL